MMVLIFWAGGIMLAAAALLTVIRMIVGPTVLNRALAADALVAIIVCALGLEAVASKDAWALPILITLSLLGFISSVAIARFAARDVDDRPTGAGEPIGPGVRATQGPHIPPHTGAEEES